MTNAYDFFPHDDSRHYWYKTNTKDWSVISLSTPVTFLYKSQRQRKEKCSSMVTRRGENTINVEDKNAEMKENRLRVRG